MVRFRNNIVVILAFGVRLRKLPRSAAPHVLPIQHVLPRELPRKRLRSSVAQLLVQRQTQADCVQSREIVRRQHLVMDDRKVKLDPPDWAQRFRALRSWGNHDSPSSTRAGGITSPTLTFATARPISIAEAIRPDSPGFRARLAGALAASQNSGSSCFTFPSNELALPRLGRPSGQSVRFPHRIRYAHISKR